MNLKRVIKREITITAIITVSVLTALLSVSYAIYFAVDEKNIGSISFGQITFDACMDESCSTGGTTYGEALTGDVYPMNTTEGTSQTPYLFKVTNNGTSVMNTRVYAAKEGTSSDYTNVKLAAKVQGTSTYSYADLTQDTSILIDLQVPVGQSKIIEVYMWIDEEASNSIIGKTITAFINAMGYYKPDDPNNLHTGDTYIANVSAPLVQGQTFSYTGNYQEFEAPISGYYFIETWGAQGGNGANGGYSSGYLYLSKGEKIYVYVGGVGQTSATNANAGGYNGGGYGGDYDTIHGYGGGGATDIRYFGNTTPSASDLEWDSTLGLNSRIMVAGGGGAIVNDSVNTYMPGAGGTLVGVSGSGSYVETNVAVDPTGGGQSVAGIGGNTTPDTRSGSFGMAPQVNTTGFGGGGGGGYYGGGNGYGRAGAGGSSFISGYAGSDAITSASDRTHTHNTLHYSGKYFLDGTMKAGIREGNGQAKIKYVGIKEKTNTKLDNIRYIKDCTIGNTANVGNHWVEIQAIKDGINIAKNKTITGTSPEANNTTYAYSNIVDGQVDNITGSSGFGYTGTAGTQCVTVDLGNTYNLDEMSTWRYYQGERVYYSNMISVSSNNSSWTTLINEIAIETSNGKRVSAYSETINGYVQDGLLVWYDGIANTGSMRSTSTTTWKNLVSDSYDGAITNGTWGTNNLYLSGSSSGVVSASTISYGTSSTSEAVVKIANSPAFVIDMRNSSGVGMQPLYSSNNAANFQVHASASGNSDYALTSYYDVKTSFSVMLNSNGNRLYTNGALAASGAVAKGMSGSANLYVGRRYSNASNLKGNVFVVRFYNRALTEDEIYHNYLIDKERYGLQ